MSRLFKNLLSIKNNYWLLIYLFIPLFVLNFIIVGEQQYVYLAHAFSKFSFSLVELPKSLSDFAYFNGKYYWPIGPFPAVLLLPFVLIFNTNFSEGFIKFPLTIINLYLVYKICQSLKLQNSKALFVAIFFIFGSIYTPVASLPYSSYFAHITATTLLLIALLEFLNRRRYLLIGLTLSLAFLARPTTLSAVLFFLYFLKQKPDFLYNIFKLTLPILLSLIFTAYYNYARFGSILDSGYQYQLIPEESVQRRAGGLFSTNYIPKNLYYLIFKPPDLVLTESHPKFPFLKYNPYGMSIFILSPILLLIVRTDSKRKIVKISFITILATLIPILLYYGIGWRQIGYRYALDFAPFLLIPLVIALKKINIKTIGILVLSGVLITWFFIFEFLAGL